MRVLNLYAGIGGNRKLWEDVEVTAVELNEEIASIYKEYFPDDTLIIADAHEYLLKHYKEFDFIWSSPPCQSHSGNNKFLNPQGIVRYPDMALYQEILFLKFFYKGKFVVENTAPYYRPLVEPDLKIERHLFWTNYTVNKYKFSEERGNINNVTRGGTHYGINLRRHKIKHRKDVILRNMVNPDLGLYILEQARGIIRENNQSQMKLFS